MLPLSYKLQKFTIEIAKQLRKEAKAAAQPAQGDKVQKNAASVPHVRHVRVPSTTPPPHHTLTKRHRRCRRLRATTSAATVQILTIPRNTNPKSTSESFNNNNNNNNNNDNNDMSDNAIVAKIGNMHFQFVGWIIGDSWKYCYY